MSVLPDCVFGRCRSYPKVEKPRLRATFAYSYREPPSCGSLLFRTYNIVILYWVLKVSGVTTPLTTHLLV